MFNTPLAQMTGLDLIGLVLIYQVLVMLLSLALGFIVKQAIQLFSN